jgi:hypothetical protein
MTNFIGADICLDNSIKQKVQYTGFVAQEVQESAEELNFNFSGIKIPENPDDDMFGIRYAEFVVPLVKAVQELNAKIEDQDIVIRTQKTELEEYQKAELEEYQKAYLDLSKRLKELEIKVSNNEETVAEK